MVQARRTRSRVRSGGVLQDQRKMEVEGTNHTWVRILNELNGLIKRR